MSDFNPLKVSNYADDCWWKSDKGNVADSITKTLETLMAEQKYISRRFMRAISLYENIDVGNLIAWQFASVVDRDGPYQYNIVEQIVDTLHAEIISNRTRPQFFTEGGDWLSQERAQDLTSFADGLFMASEVHELVAPSVCLDALVFGTGIVKVWAEGGKIKASRIFPHEVMVDDIAAALSPPRSMYHVRHLSRDSVLAQFGDDKKSIEIIEAAPLFDSSVFESRPTKDIISIHEAWRLPTAKEKGRHVISLTQGVLVDEEWDNDWFPFVFLRYKPRTKGFWGKGVPEILEGHQELINDMRDKINAQLAMAAPMIWIKTGSRIKEADLSNQIGKVIESDDAPQYIVNNAVPADLMQRQAQEVADAGSLVGANTLMMKSELPPGLNSGSGRALRIYNDTKSKRFMRFAREYESFHISLCKLMIRMSDNAADAGEKVEVIYDSDTYIERANYNKIRLPEGEYVIKAQPVNFLSDTPAGRLSDIEALAAIFPDELKPKLASLLQNPDLKSATNYLNADEDAIGKACYSILRGKKSAADVGPSPYLNLELAISMARTILLDAQTKGAPVDRLLDLENWVEMCKMLMDKAQPPPQPQALPLMPEQPMLPDPQPEEMMS